MTATTPIIICDLDNCLCDDSWRIPSIRWDLSVEAGRYDAYHAQCGSDRPNNELMDRLLEESANGVMLVYFTARPEAWRPETSLWLSTRGLIPNGALLFMRSNSDHSPSLPLKRKMFESLMDTNNMYTVGVPEVSEAFDDREDVLDMYKSFGVRATRVAIHTTCAYTPPEERVPRAAASETFPLRAPEILRLGEKTFKDRSTTYGDAYVEFGPIMASFFPRGINISPGDAAAFARFALFSNCAAKLARYANALPTHSGHSDSARDLMVYAAMLEELTPTKKETK